MTPEQQKHLDHIQTELLYLVRDKYRAGAALHTDSLLDKTPLQLINEAIEENIDSLVYLLTAKQKLNEFKNRYNEGGLVGIGPLGGSEPILPKTPLRPFPRLSTDEELSLWNF